MSCNNINLTNRTLYTSTSLMPSLSSSSSSSPGPALSSSLSPDDNKENFIKGCSCGNVQLTQSYISKVDTEVFTEGLNAATANNQESVTTMLINDQRFNLIETFHTAVTKGYVYILKTLLKDPDNELDVEDYVKALKEAKDPEVLKVLLECLNLQQYDMEQVDVPSTDNQIHAQSAYDEVIKPTLGALFYHACYAGEYQMEKVFIESGTIDAEVVITALGNLLMFPSNKTKRVAASLSKNIQSLLQQMSDSDSKLKSLQNKLGYVFVYLDEVESVKLIFDHRPKGFDLQAFTNACMIGSDEVIKFYVDAYSKGAFNITLTDIQRIKNFAEERENAKLAKLLNDLMCSITSKL